MVNGEITSSSASTTSVILLRGAVWFMKARSAKTVAPLMRRRTITFLTLVLSVMRLVYTM